MAKFNSSAAADITNQGVGKTINPGTHLVRVRDINFNKLERQDRNGNDQYHIELIVETPPMGDGFNGMAVDKNNPNLGTYEGQIGFVKATRYPFSNYIPQNGGKAMPFDEAIYRWISLFANTIGLKEILRAAEIDTEDISEYFYTVKPYLVNEDRWFWITVAGEEYEKNGYINYGLYIHRREKVDGSKTSFALPEADAAGNIHVDTYPSTLIPYDADRMIIKKREAPSVASFNAPDAGQPGTVLAGDLSADLGSSDDGGLGLM